MLCLRGFDTVQVSKVKGHATRAMVDNGDVRLEDLVGNNGADAAADLGRLRQQDDVITARRDLLRFVAFGTPSFSIFINSWLLFLVLRSIMMVFGGTAPNAMVWDKGGIVKTRASLLSSDCRLCYSSWSSWFLE